MTASLFSCRIQILSPCQMTVNVTFDLIFSYSHTFLILKKLLINLDLLATDIRIWFSFHAIIVDTPKELHDFLVRSFVPLSGKSLPKEIVFR